MSYVNVDIALDMSQRGEATATSFTGAVYYGIMLHRFTAKVATIVVIPSRVHSWVLSSSHHPAAWEVTYRP